MMKRLLSIAVLAATLAPTPATAQSAPAPAYEFTASGFLTAAAGRILSGTHDPDTNGGFTCPCFIADYAQAGIYEQGPWRAAPDSKLGAQARIATADQRYSFTAQVVSRGAARGAVNLEWAYGAVQLNPHLTLQLGRKRLPLFAYSEVQDVGLALPWIHLPPQLYGWEIVNYNGANLLYQGTWGGWASSANLFAGHETARDAGYWKIYNGKHSRTDSRWTQIVGGEVKFARGGFDARYVYMQSFTQNRQHEDESAEYGDRKRQRIHGLSFSLERGQWLGKLESLWIDRRADYGRDQAQMAAIGYRVGRFTPLLSFSNYRALPNEGGIAERHRTTSLVLRYDLTTTSALKVQFDQWRDRSAEGYESMHGHSRLVTISYDRVF